MRAKELADLTGTTVRTVRHYHHLGLLPVPEVRYARRDYDLSHVARMTRIRWLTRAGVRLDAVPGMLTAATVTEPDPDGGTGTAVADLRATLDGIEVRLHELSQQREQVLRLLSAAEHGQPLSPMPASLVRFYDDLERRSTDERVRREIRRERDFNELAFYRGDMPPEVALLFEGLGEPDLEESLALYGTMAHRAAETMGKEDVAAFASGVADRLRRRLGDDLPRVARSLDAGTALRAAELYVATCPEAERVLARAIGRAITEVLEEARR